MMSRPALLGSEEAMVRAVQFEESGVSGSKDLRALRSLIVGREEAVAAQWRGRRESGSGRVASFGFVVRRDSTAWAGGC
jgi:hypothetical protein